MNDARDNVLAVLRRQKPERLVYAPNYWQWFVHHRHHNLLPPELRNCQTQLEMLDWLGVDVFSRNLYCDEQQGWFGGLACEQWTGVAVETECQTAGQDRLIIRHYHTRHGRLCERLRYVFAESTLVQEKFALDDPDNQLEALAELLSARRWQFLPHRWLEHQAQVGNRGLVIAGELHSPLKVLHLLAGAVNASFLITDHGDRIKELLARHEEAQLDLAAQMAAAGVPAVMSMDNLDSAFHTPRYVERFSASFYERASRICHTHGSAFFIHACGRQKANLPLISGLGVDGLEGVAFPPLGDVELDEAMRLTGDRFLITGGISAMQTRDLQTYAEVSNYIGQLCERMRPYAHRFILSSSCNTAIDAPWETIQWFRDAWRDVCG